MTSTHDVMLFKQQVREVHRQANDGHVKAAAVSERLAALELSTTSHCGLVHAFHDGNGALADLAIDEAAFDQHDSEELGRAICLTVRAGESVIRDVHLGMK